MTIGSGPAAGVAAALHQLSLRAGLVVECGGTSSNISVVRDGRTVLRSLRVMGRPTAIRAIDSWVVGAAGGSMARLGRRKVAEVGPRSAHVAGLPYACFATPEDLAGARVDLIAPRTGDLESYATLRAGDVRYALTATCAANALGLVPAGSYAAGNREAAVAGFALLAAHLRADPVATAQAVLDGAVSKIAEAVTQAARAYDLPRDTPVVALGGAGAVLGAEVARRLGRPLLVPDHPEVLSSIGAALSLVRAEAVRTSTAAGTALRVARDAELACIAAGAAASTISVETTFDPRTGEQRAVATGAVALQAGASSALQCGDDELAIAAAEALHVDAGSLRLVAVTDYYRDLRGARGRRRLGRRPARRDLVRRGDPVGHRGRHGCPDREAARGHHGRLAPPRHRDDDPARDPDLRPEHPRPVRRAPRRGRADRGADGARRPARAGRRGRAALMSLYRSPGRRSYGAIAAALVVGPRDRRRRRLSRRQVRPGVAVAGQGPRAGAVHDQARGRRHLPDRGRVPDRRQGRQGGRARAAAGRARTSWRGSRSRSPTRSPTWS